MVYEGTYFFPININSLYYIFPKTKSFNTIFPLSIIINGNIKIICYDSKDVIPPYFGFISRKIYNALSPLHIPMREHDNIMDENNRKEDIEFGTLVSIVTQDNVYDYIDEF